MGIEFDGMAIRLTPNCTCGLTACKCSTSLPIQSLGWECPKCGAVYSPTWGYCINCKPRFINGDSTFSFSPHCQCWYCTPKVVSDKK